MAAVCDVCGKGPGFGMSVSHSHRRTHRRWNPNIQTVRARIDGGNRQRLNVCTSCLKAGKVSPRLISRRRPAPCQGTGRSCICAATGSFQSTGSPPSSSSRALTRLNGFEPKKPRSADIGDGCADST